MEVPAAPSRRHELAPFAWLALAWLVLYLPLLAGLRVLPWDALDQFYPTVYFNAHSLRHGIAPWWNPYIYGGYPQIADPQGMLFSPLLMAWMLLPSSPGTTWFAWGVVLHLLLGACAMLALLRRWQSHAFGALAGALVYLAGGVASSRLEHVPIVLAYAYAPLVLLAMQRFLDVPGWRRGMLLGAAAGALLTHLVQLTYLLAFVCAAYGIVGSANRWRGYSPRERLRWVAGLGAALPVILILGLPQLLFSLAFVLLSNRVQLPLDAALPGSLEWRAFLSMLSPNAFHALRGNYDGPASLVEAFLYIGAVPTLWLAWIGRAWREPGQREPLLFFGVVAVVAVLYMLGVHTPFYGWLYQWLPGIKQFRRPADAAYLLNLSLAVAVGLAAAHYPWTSRRHAFWLVGVAAAWLLISSLAMRGEGARWLPVSLLPVLFAGLALWRIRRPAGWLAWWLLALIVVDYRTFNLNGRFNETRDSARSFLQHETTAFLSARTQAAPGQLPARFEPVDAPIGWDNLGVLRELRSTQGYNPLRYQLHDSWYGSRGSGSDHWPGTPYNPGPGSAMSALLGAEFLLRDNRLQRPLVPLPESYERVLAGEVEIWRNPSVYPTLLTPTEARLATGVPEPDAFGATDFRRTVWLTPRNAQDHAQARQSLAACTHALQVESASMTPTHVSVRLAPSAHPGWLVLSELDFPGWNASVDDVPVPIHRANGMFRALCVPAGTRAVALHFDPWAMVAEAWQQRRAPDGL
jgi:hypothetical protein